MGLRKDAEEHRQLILRTAQSLFAKHGVDSVSMHQIAKTSGIGQGTLYRNYSNKADLCLDIIRESGRKLDESVQTILRMEAPGMSVKGKLEDVLKLLVAFLEEKSQWLEAVQAPTCPEGGSAFYRSSVYEWLHGTIRSLLEEGIRCGECQKELDPVFGADALLSSLDPDLFRFLTQVRGYSTEAYLRNLRMIWLNPLFASKKDGPEGSES